VSVESAPGNRLEEALASAIAGQIGDPEFFGVLWESELLLPQPFAPDEGASTHWQIAVFHGVCPVYSSVAQLVKGVGPDMAYAQVPVPTVVEYWDPERPMSLNLAADNGLQIPGAIIKGLPELPESPPESPPAG
jgi:type III secretion system (T3SS) SseB-like protein